MKLTLPVGTECVRFMGRLDGHRVLDWAVAGYTATHTVSLVRDLQLRRKAVSKPILTLFLCHSGVTF